MFSVKEARHKRPQLVGSHLGEMSADKPQTKPVRGCQGLAAARIGDDGSRDLGFLWAIKTLWEWSKG